MHIAGYQKLSLQDYPKKVAAICFVAGCQLRCAYCHNAELIFKDSKINSDTPCNQAKEFLHYLEKRKSCLEGVVISGGEPLLQTEIVRFTKKIKGMGLQIKLDTNGLLPGRLKDLLERRLIDYVALDYKNCSQFWNETVGLHQSEAQKVNQIDKWYQSLSMLRNVNIPYEIRTTVVKQLHPPEALTQMAKTLSATANNKTEKWFLQSFKRSGKILREYKAEYENKEAFEAYSPQEMQQRIEHIKRYVPGVKLRA